MRLLATLLTAATAGALLTGCAGSKAPELDCVTPPDGIAERILDGATAYTLSPVAVGAVRSPEMKQVTLVAVKFTIEGNPDPEVGVWGVADAGTIVGIDGFAHEFTQWPAQVNGHKFNVTEPGVEDAKACLDD